MGIPSRKSNNGLPKTPEREPGSPSKSKKKILPTKRGIPSTKKSGIPSKKEPFSNIYSNEDNILYMSNCTGKTEEEVIELADKQIENLCGLIDLEGALVIVSKNLNVDLRNRKEIKIDNSKIKTIEGFQRSYQITNETLQLMLLETQSKYSAKMDLVTLRKALLQSLQSMKNIDIIKYLKDVANEKIKTVKKGKIKLSKVPSNKSKGAGKNDSVSKTNESTSEQKKVEKMDEVMDLDLDDLTNISVESKVNSKSKLTEKDLDRVKETMSKFNLEQNFYHSQHYLRLSMDANSSDESYRNWKHHKWHEAQVINYQSKVHMQIHKEKKQMHDELMQIRRNRLKIELKKLELMISRPSSVNNSDEVSLLKREIEVLQKTVAKITLDHDTVTEINENLAKTEEKYRNELNDLKAEADLKDLQIQALQDVKSKKKSRKKTTKKSTKKIPKKRAYV